MTKEQKCITGKKLASIKEDYLKNSDVVFSEYLRITSGNPRQFIAEMKALL